MKFFTRCFILCLFLFTGKIIHAQTIAKQGFESSGDTWNYIENPSTYNISGDVWDIVSTLSSISPSDGSSFWGMQDLENENGGGAFEHTLTLHSVDISSYTNVQITFDYYIIGYDAGDYLGYQIKYDGGLWSSTIQFTSSSGWNTQTINVSDSYNSVELKLIGKQNGGSDYAGFDNIKITGTMACTPPTITSFVPTTGSVGTRITIAGSGFTSLGTTTAVNFGSTPATSFAINSDTEITAIVPSGSSSEKITVTTNSCNGTSTGSFTIIDQTGTCGGGSASDLFISEYVEGSSNNKYIEIYNGTGSSIDLSDYELHLFSNGASSPNSYPSLTGTLNDGDVIVYKNSSATAYSGSATSSSACNFNGDDAVAIYKVSTSSYVDIFGNIGCDPGSYWSGVTNETSEKTLVRNSDICSGISSDPSSTCPFPTLDTEWTEYNQDNVSNLGTHTASCSGGATVPTINTHPSDATNICEGSSSTFSVTASGTTLTYQWKLNTGGLGWSDVSGGDYSGETTNTLTINDVIGKNNYQYYCQVTEAGTCSKASNAAILTVISCGATITAQPIDQEVCEDEIVTFTVTAMGVPTLTYQWRVLEYGATQWVDVAGAISNVLNITPDISMNGNQYFCEITDGNSNCIVSDAALLTVNPLPEIPVIEDVTQNCGSTVLTRANPPTGVTWFWQGTTNNGTNTGNNNLTYTTTSNGTYYLRAQINATACWSANSTNETIVVKQIPTAGLSVTANCGLGSATITSSLTGEQTYELLDNSGASLSPARTWTGNTASHDFGGLSNGNYKAIVTKEGCTSTITSSSTLTNNAIPDAPTMADNSRCNDGDVLMTANIGIGGIGIEFSEDGSTVDDTDNSSPYQYNMTGVTTAASKILYARTTNGSCQSEWINAQAISVPNVGNPTAIQGAASPRCQQAITEIYTTTATDVEQFTWEITGATEGTDFNFQGSKTTISEQVSWNANFSGTVTVRVQANNICGSSSQTEETITINPNVTTPIFDNGATSSFCQNLGSVLKITYPITVSNQTSLTYSISNCTANEGTCPTINASTGEVSYPVNFNGTIEITAEAAGCDGPKTAIHTVTVNETPDGVLIITPTN